MRREDGKVGLVVTVVGEDDAMDEGDETGENDLWLNGLVVDLKEVSGLRLGLVFGLFVG